MEETFFDRLERMMTLKEFCFKYGYSEKSVVANFKRTAESFEKKYGKKLVKNNIFNTYIVEDLDIHLYEEIKKKLNKEILNRENFRFFALEGILAAPCAAFRGTPAEFLESVGIEINDDNLLELKEVLEELAEKQYIRYDIDEDVFIIFPKNNMINQIKLENIIKSCEEIVNKYHKNKDKFFQLIKCWIVMEFCFCGDTLSYDNISYLTGLSEIQIRDVKKLLLMDNNFKESLVGNYLKNRKGRF